MGLLITRKNSDFVNGSSQILPNDCEKNRRLSELLGRRDVNFFSDSWKKYFMDNFP